MHEMAEFSLAHYAIIPKNNAKSFIEIGYHSDSRRNQLGTHARFPVKT